MLSLACLAAPLPAAASPSRETRIAAVAYRIGVAARPYCDRQVGLAGWQLQYLDDFDAALRADLAAALAMDKGPNVAALAPDGPAARAGMLSGDTITAIDGQALPAGRKAGETALAGALLHAPVRVTVSRAGQPIDLTLNATPGCGATVRIVPIDRRNAFADGHAVIASTRIIDLTADDGELAALLAHEFAHNYLHHGVASPVAPPPAILRAEETEADRFSVTLMAAAGYDLAAAPRFWSKLLHDTREVAKGYGSHASRRERLRALAAEIARVRASPDLAWDGVAADRPSK